MVTKTRTWVNGDGCFYAWVGSRLREGKGLVSGGPDFRLMRMVVFMVG